MGAHGVLESSEGSCTHVRVCDVCTILQIYLNMEMSCWKQQKMSTGSGSGVQILCVRNYSIPFKALRPEGDLYQYYQVT